MSAAQCIRDVGNISLANDARFKLDNPEFNPALFMNLLPIVAPKLIALIENIRKKDALTPGEMFKHVIYVDSRSALYGARMIAGAMTAAGFRPAVLRNTSIDPFPGPSSFAVLSATEFYGKSMTATLKKQILDVFNERPGNIHGERIRFMILDSSYREGIDLYDVKYLHIMEPLLSDAELRQVIGRSTRMCGQYGLQFNPDAGWPLYVTRYQLVFTGDLKKHYGVDTLFDLYKQHTPVKDKKLAGLLDIMESAVQDAAVDKVLTAPIHEFSLKNARKPGAAATEPAEVKDRKWQNLFGLISTPKFLKPVEVPVKPATEPVEVPIKLPTEPVEVPIKPATAPVEIPIKPATEPVEMPVKPTTEPVEVPIKPATAPVEVPIKPVTAPVEVPVKLTTEPVEVPVKLPTEPVEVPVKPVTEFVIVPVKPVEVPIKDKTMGIYTQEDEIPKVEIYKLPDEPEDNNIKVKILGGASKLTPAIIMNNAQMNEFIIANYVPAFKWPEPLLENTCTEKKFMKAVKPIDLEIEFDNKNEVDSDNPIIPEFDNRKQDKFVNRDRDDDEDRDRVDFSNRKQDKFVNRDRDDDEDRVDFDNRTQDKFMNRDRDDFGNRKQDKFVNRDRDNFGNRKRDKFNGDEDRDRKRDKFNNRNQNRDKFNNRDRIDFGNDDDELDFDDDEIDFSNKKRDKFNNRNRDRMQEFITKTKDFVNTRTRTRTIDPRRRRIYTANNKEFENYTRGLRSLEKDTYKD